MALNVIYNELSEEDKSNVIELANNTLKAQEKAERPLYFKDLAQRVKLELDGLKGGKWNVIVGKSFGSYVSHETKTYASTSTQYSV